jgi:hypothetical protein
VDSGANQAFEYKDGKRPIDFFSKEKWGWRKNFSIASLFTKKRENITIRHRPMVISHQIEIRSSHTAAGFKLQKKMKLSLLWLCSTCILMGQNEDPFKEKDVSSTKSDESVYDFDDVHKWNDIIVKGIGKAQQSLITWSSANVASHRGVTGKRQNLEFYIDAKLYNKALHHPDFNRGVILMAGDIRFPLLHCWLRPFSVHDGKAIFVVSIPVERLEDTFIAFIPHDGKERHIYNLKEVVLGIKSIPKARK